MGTNYLDKEELNKELDISIKNNKITDKLCSMFYLIARHFASIYIMNHEDKQDMIQKAIYFCVKYYRNIDTERDAFAYITQSCKSAFYQYFNSEGGYEKFITDTLRNATLEFDKKFKNK